MAKTFDYTDGNETITGYNGGDTIQIASGKVDGYCFDGNDLIFAIGDGSLRLVDMKGRAITVKDSSRKKATTKVYGTGYTGQEVIKNLVMAWTKTKLMGIPKLDESIQLCSHFKSIQDVIDHMVADCRAAGDADTFLKKYCGIILNNNDIGAITGWDAGGLRVKTPKNTIPKKTPLEHLDDYTQASFVRNNVTINISSTGDSLTADGKKVFDGLYSWWAEGVLNLIEESYGVKFRTGNEINIALTPSASYWAHTSGNKDVTISLRHTRFKNAEDYQGNGVDKTIAHEFTHIAQALFMGSLPQFLKEGLADLTCGIDRRKTSLIKKVAGDADKLKRYLDLGKSGTGNPNYYAAGFIFYRYLAKQASDAYDSLSSYAWTDNHLTSGTSKADFITKGKAVSISGGKGNDSIISHGAKSALDGGIGNDFIYNGYRYYEPTNYFYNATDDNFRSNLSTIFGDAGNDYISNIGDKVSIDASTGKDFISNGNDYCVGGSCITISGSKLKKST